MTKNSIKYRKCLLCWIIKKIMFSIISYPIIYSCLVEIFLYKEIIMKSHFPKKKFLINALSKTTNLISYRLDILFREVDRVGIQGARIKNTRPRQLGF